MIKEDLSRKIVLITGSTDGLGKLVARDLAGEGAAVLLHGRNEQKGLSVLDELSGAPGNEKLKYFNGNYSSLEEVNRLADKILDSQEYIDILINNVGIGSGLSDGNRRELSRDGFELRLAVNYLSHVLLTEKLIPILKQGTSRIINVASIGQETIDFSNLMLERKYDGFLAYKRSKTALIMYTFDLAERLKATGIKVNAVHPASLMNTKMVLVDWGRALTTVEQGAEAVENLLHTDLTGAFFEGKRQADAISQAYDPESRARLREITSELLQKYLGKYTLQGDKN